MEPSCSSLPALYPYDDPGSALRLVSVLPAMTCRGGASCPLCPYEPVEAWGFLFHGLLELLISQAKQSVYSARAFQTSDTSDDHINVSDWHTEWVQSCDAVSLLDFRSHRSGWEPRCAQRSGTQRQCHPLVANSRPGMVATAHADTTHPVSVIVHKTRVGDARLTLQVAPSFRSHTWLILLEGAHTHADWTALSAGPPAAALLASVSAATVMEVATAAWRPLGVA